MPKAIFDTVVDILTVYVERERLTEAPPQEIYLQNLGVMSSDLITIIVEVEDTFGIEIDDHDLYRLLTLGDVVRAIEAQRPGEGK